MSIAYLTTAQAARILGVEPGAIREQLERGNLAGYRQDNTRRTWRIDAASLDELIQRREAEKQARSAQQSADGSIAIVLSSGAIAYVDTEDADLASFTWTHARNGYATREKGMLYLHRIIAKRAHGVSSDMSRYADHIDRDKLNNRRGNIRIATPSQSCVNRQTKGGSKSGYRGVYWMKGYKSSPWKAAIGVNRKSIHLGYFSTPEEAARVYNDAALRIYGEFAILNHITE